MIIKKTMFTDASGYHESWFPDASGNIDSRFPDASFDQSEQQETILLFWLVEWCVREPWINVPRRVREPRFMVPWRVGEHRFLIIIGTVHWLFNRFTYFYSRRWMSPVWQSAERWVDKTALPRHNQPQPAPLGGSLPRLPAHHSSPRRPKIKQISDTLQRFLPVDVTSTLCLVWSPASHKQSCHCWLTRPIARTWSRRTLFLEQTSSLLPITRENKFIRVSVTRCQRTLKMLSKMTGEFLEDRWRWWFYRQTS